MQSLQAFTPKTQARGFIVPNFIQDNENISIGAKYLYGVLCDYARDKNFCYPSKKTLAKQLNASLNTIRNYLKELASHGFIKAFFNGVKDIFYLFCPIKNNDYKNSQYINNNVNEENKDSKFENISQNQGGANFEQGGANFEPKTNLKETKLINPLPPENIISKPVKKVGGVNFKIINKEFEEVWNLYPKKEAQESARAMWFRLFRQNKLPSMDILKKSIAYFDQSYQWQKKNGQYIPQMVNFLRGLRWEDWTEDFQTNKENKPNSTTPKVESLADKKQRSEQIKLEKEKEKEKAKKLDEAWGKFESYFVCDSTLHRFMAQCIFIEQFNQNNILEIYEKQNMTVYEYLIQNNYIKSIK